MSCLIELCNIKKSYHLGESTVEILHGINLSINQGELIAIMGASGSGKSTLMNIIGLLDRPTAGEYLLNNEKTAHINDDQRSELRNQTIGFVFQSFFLLPRLTAAQNVTLPLTYRNPTPTDSSTRCLNLLDRVGIKKYAHHKPLELSGGQQQRVAIARALIGEPNILLADEPTGALDSKTSNEVIRLFKDLNKNTKMTTIIVTHDPAVAKQCQRIIYIADGTLVNNI